ncbi:MAG: hypothetical protein PVSMB4_01500 [Ktedonobacterales bacterium]
MAPAYRYAPQVYATPGYPPYAAYGTAYSPYPGSAGYGYQYAAANHQPPYYYPYYYYMPVRPRRAPGETYRLVLAWIVTVGSGLALLGGLALGALAVLAGIGGFSSGLATVTTFTGFVIGGVGGGAAGLYYGITALLRRPSARFNFPPAWLFLALTVLVLVGGVVLWNVYPAPGPVPAVAPLVLLAGLLPGLTILAFAARALRFPSTWRHVALSLIHGATLAILLALILEVILQFAIMLILLALGYHVSGTSLSSLTNPDPSNTGEVLFVLLLLSVVAPLVEEGVKPLGAILVMPRIRSASEAFLLGLAAGIGFDFVETIGYIGMGEADWISVAIQRVGAGLLHGVGAGMGALGWYYLMRGKGVPHRWLRGFGALVYAVLQHAIFNGSNLLTLLPGQIGKLFTIPLYLGKLPLDSGTLLFFFYYAVIVAVLVIVTMRLRRGDEAVSVKPADPGQPGQPGASVAVQGAPQPVPGGAR